MLRSSWLVISSVQTITMNGKTTQSRAFQPILRLARKKQGTKNTGNKVKLIFARTLGNRSNEIKVNQSTFDYLKQLFKTDPKQMEISGKGKNEIEMKAEVPESNEEYNLQPNILDAPNSTDPERDIGKQNLHAENPDTKTIDKVVTKGIWWPEATSKPTEPQSQAETISETVIPSDPDEIKQEQMDSKDKSPFLDFLSEPSLMSYFAKIGQNPDAENLEEPMLDLPEESLHFKVHKCNHCGTPFSAEHFAIKHLKMHHKIFNGFEKWITILDN